MNNNTPTQSMFGCPSCKAIPRAGEAPQLTLIRVLLADPHEEFVLGMCSACGQVYLNHFKEVGSIDGKDDLWSRWVPLTRAEHERLDEVFVPGSHAWDRADILHKLLHSRPRLVRGPDGAYSWAHDGHDMCDWVRPGW